MLYQADKVLSCLLNFFFPILLAYYTLNFIISINLMISTNLIVSIPAVLFAFLFARVVHLYRVDREHHVVLGHRFLRPILAYQDCQVHQGDPSRLMGRWGIFRLVLRLRFALRARVVLPLLVYLFLLLYQ